MPKRLALAVRQDLTHGRTVIFDPNVSGAWGGGVRHGMCFQSLSKFGQAVCDMGDLIVLNIEERGWRFNTGPNTICDEIVGRSLHPDLRKTRGDAERLFREVLSFESQVALIRLASFWAPPVSVQTHQWRCGGVVFPRVRSLVESRSFSIFFVAFQCFTVFAVKNSASSSCSSKVDHRR